MTVLNGTQLCSRAWWEHKHFSRQVLISDVNLKGKGCQKKLRKKYLLWLGYYLEVIRHHANILLLIWNHVYFFVLYGYLGQDNSRSKVKIIFGEAFHKLKDESKL